MVIIENMLKIKKSVSSNVIINRIVYYIFDKYLSLFIWFYMMNIIKYNFDSFWDEWILATILNIPVSCVITYIIRKILPSSAERMIFLFLAFILCERYWIDIFDFFPFVFLSVAILILIRNSNNLLALVFVFFSISFDFSIAILLIPILLSIYKNKNYRIDSLDILFDKKFFGIVVVVVIFSTIESVIIGVLAYGKIIRFLSPWIFFDISKFKIALMTVACVKFYNDYKEKNEQYEQNKIIYFLSIIYMLCGITLNDRFAILFSLMLVAYLLAKKIYSIIKGYSRVCKTEILSYIKVISLVVAVRQIIQGFFYAASGKNPSYLYTICYMSFQQFGFIQRGVLGSIIELILGWYIPENVLLQFLNILMVILRLLLFWFVYSFMRMHRKNDAYYEISFLCCLISFIPYYSCYPPDYINLLIGFTCIYFALKNRVTLFFVPVLCFLGITTHTAFVSLVFPMVFSILVYRAFIESEDHRARNIFVLIITLCVVAVSFIYYSYFNANSIQFTLDEIVANINERSGGFFNVDTYQIQYVYLDKDLQHYKIYSNMNSSKTYYNLLKYCIMLIPTLSLYVLSFVLSAKNEKKICNRIAYYISMISILAIVPLFIRDTDFGRWIAHIAMIATIIPMVLLSLQKENQWKNGIKSNYLNGIMILTSIFLLLLPAEPGMVLKYFELWI